MQINVCLEARRGHETPLQMGDEMAENLSFENYSTKSWLETQ